MDGSVGGSSHLTKVAGRIPEIVINIVNLRYNYRLNYCLF